MTAMKLVLLDGNDVAVGELPNLERYNLDHAAGRSAFLYDIYWLVKGNIERGSVLRDERHL